MYELKLGKSTRLLVDGTAIDTEDPSHLFILLLAWFRIIESSVARDQKVFFFFCLIHLIKD